MGDVVIEVIQSDRDAYAAYIRLKNGDDTDEATIAALLAGDMDDKHGVQIARQGRLASETALRLRVAVLEGALREPTEAMWEAAWEATQGHFVGDNISAEGFRKGIGAMLAALKQETLA